MDIKRHKKIGQMTGSSSPGDVADELCPICDDICTCRKKKPTHQSGTSSNNIHLWEGSDFSLAPARKFPYEYSTEEEESEEDEFDETWLQALYSSSSCQEDNEEEREIMEEEEAYMLEEDDETSLPPEAEKILYDYYAEQRKKDSSGLEMKTSSSVPEVLELEFDLDQSHWGAIDTTPVSHAGFIVTPTATSNSSSNNNSTNKEIPDLTPQVLAAISAATKQSHRIITIAEIDQSDFSDDGNDTLSLWSQLITDLDDDTAGEEESEQEESDGDYTSDSKEAVEDEWYRYKRIPINAFYKSRKGRRTSVCKQTVVPQGALRARGEALYLSAPMNYNSNNVLLRYSTEESERIEKEEEGLYWKSTMMDIY